MKGEAEEVNWIAKGSGVVVVMRVVSLTVMTVERCSTSLAVASAVALTALAAAAVVVEVEVAVSLS